MHSPVTIRLAVFDERPIVRAGIAACLSTAGDLQLVGNVSSIQECVERSVSHAPDVVLIGSVRYPSVATVIGEVLKACLDVRVVVLSNSGGDARARSAIEAGADGFILQGSSAQELAQAVRSVFAGKRYMDSATALEMARNNQEDNLRAKEVEVLRRVAAGKSNREIATELSTTEGTVKNHIKRILTKLDAQDRTHAVVIAAERGFITVNH